MTHDISLRDYFDTRIKSLEDKIDALAQYTEQHFTLKDTALDKTEAALNLRLSHMNEFREQVLSERNLYATKESTNLLLNAYDNRLKRLENINAFSSGKMWMVMAGFAAIPTILSLWVLLQ